MFDLVLLEEYFDENFMGNTIELNSRNDTGVIYMEIWDGYYRDGTLAGMELIRGEDIPQGLYHMVCEAVIHHTDGTYLLMQRSYQKEIFPGNWEIGAGGSALKGENKTEAILREIMEETGIDDGDLKEIYHLAHDKHQSIYYGFLLTTSCDKNSIRLQEGETIDYKWITKKELIEFFESSQCIPNSKERLKDFINSIK